MEGVLLDRSNAVVAHSDRRIQLLAERQVEGVGLGSLDDVTVDPQLPQAS